MRPRTVILWPAPGSEQACRSLDEAARVLVARARAHPGRGEIRLFRVEADPFPGAETIHVRLTTDPRRAGVLLAYVIADFPAWGFPPNQTKRLREAVTAEIERAKSREQTNAVRHPQPERAVA